MYYYSGNIIGSGTALSNLNYSSIINPPDLTPYNAWTKSGNTIYNTALTGGLVGIGLNNPNAMLEITENTVKIKFGSRTTAGYIGVNHILCSTYFRILSASGGTIAYFGYINNYDLTTGAERVIYIGNNKNRFKYDW